MTDSTTYTPGEGSIAARALAHLHSVGRGVDVLSTDLATAIACDAQNLKNYLATALKHRIVRTSSMGRGKTFYCLPMLDAFDADDERNGKPLQRVVDAGAAPAVQKRGQSSVFDHGIPTPPPSSWVAPSKKAREKKGPSKKAPRPKSVALTPLTVREQRAIPTHPLATLDATPPELSCAMFNTGDLVIESPGSPALRLSKRQTADLVSYLQRFHNAAGAA